MDSFIFLQKNFLFLDKDDSWETKKNDELSIAIDIKYGRFGNNYITLKKILIIALYFKDKVQKIFLSIATANMYKFHAQYIKDDKYSYITMINGIDDIKNKKNIISPINGDETIFFSDVSEFLGDNNINEINAKNIIRRSLKCNTQIEIDPDILFIHVRGGDIFRDGGTSVVHCKYRQPPLIWYLECILAHKQRYKNCIVMIISEDRKNPCVAAIIQWCAHSNIKCIANINSLEKDYSLLMNAQSLVISKSSFLIPCLDLNKKLKFVYKFNFDWCKQGTYINSDEWLSTPGQIDKMINISLDELTLPDNLYETAQDTASIIVDWHNKNRYIMPLDFDHISF